MIRDEPRLGALPRRRDLEQPAHEVMVVLGLVAEANALSRDRDDAGLRTLEEMREMHDPAALVRQQ